MSHKIIVLLLGVVPVAVAQHASMPAGMSCEQHMKLMQHQDEMKKRGDLAMGFDQDKIRHHFQLTDDGGSIEISVTDASDDATRKQVRDHLKKIAREFAEGIFTSPIATHGEVPPGVEVLRERKALVQYSYEETAAGGRVIIHTADSRALTAMHDFLRYQIREHATGDPL